jgi:large subunit ribosomal protein L21e
MIPLSTFMKTYRVGDIVDIKNNGAQQKGMAHKVYHGKTGVIYNVTKSAVGVILYKKVGNRYIEKRVNVRVEHVSLSRSREEFLRRVKTNAAKKREAKEGGEAVQLKRLPVAPRSAREVKLVGVESLAPLPYDTHI